MNSIVFITKIQLKREPFIGLDAFLQGVKSDLDKGPAFFGGDREKLFWTKNTFIY